MTISLHTYAADSNPAGTSPFVAVPVPVGVRDGDLVIVVVAINQSATIAGTIASPPDDGWTQIIQTDSSQTVTLLAFWKTAFSEQTEWVFSLSNPPAGIVHPPANVSAVALIYGGVDELNPIEVEQALITPAATAHAVPAVSTSVDAEEVVVVLAGANAGTYTPQNGFLEVVAAATQPNLTISAQHKQPAGAGTQAAMTVPFTTSALGIALVLVLRPSAGTLTTDDVRQRLIESLPIGADKIYDLTPSGDYYAWFQVGADLLRSAVFDTLDLLRREILPSFSWSKLPDWERIFGLETSRTARRGTVPQRQAQVVASWRAAAGQGSSKPDVRAVVGTALGYIDPTQLDVVNADSVQLHAAHTWTDGIIYGIPDNSSITRTLWVYDGGKVSTAGVKLILSITHPVVSQLNFTLTSPTEKSKTWTAPFSGAFVAQSALLFALDEFAGFPIAGPWQLTVADTAVGSTGTFSWQLLVEGIGVGAVPEVGVDRMGCGHGGDVFDWGTFADPALVGTSGAAPDYDNAEQKLERMAQSHGDANLIRTLDAIPDDDYTEPGLCFPD